MSTTAEDIQQTRLEDDLRHAYELRGTHLLQGVDITKSVLQEATQAGNKRVQAVAKSQLALFSMIQGEFEEAILLASDALLYFESVRDIKGIADARYTIGGVYYRTNKYPQGLAELHHCLTAYRKLGDAANEARTLKSMGTIYEYFSDQENGIESYVASIEASKRAGDKSLESNALSPLSSIYYKLGKKSLAFETIERSIQLKTETNDIRGLAFSLYGRAKLLIKEGKAAEALPDLDRAIAIHREVGDQLGHGMAVNKLGVAHQSLGHLDLAKKCFLHALEIGRHYKVEIISYKANINLYNLAKVEGDNTSALGHLEEYKEQRENYFSHQNYSLIKSYEAILKMEALEREAKLQREINTIIGRKNAELDSFFYRVSHDLKGPISSLIGLHQVVKAEVKDPAAMEYFTMYNHQIKRINNIVMSLIDITRMKHIEVKKEEIDFQQLIDECIRSYEHLPAFKNISFRVSIEEGLRYISEWVILNTILQNLIENAIKYSQSNTEAFVRISVRTGHHQLIIEVEDNGQGIPLEHQERIFEMFHRAHEKIQGSGLGLYILKRAIERLQGDIEVRSALQQGSTFTVRLPYNG